MKQVFSSVSFQDEAGNALSNGSLIFSLPSGVYLISSGGGQVVGQSFILNLDATGKAALTLMWASDELNPQTPYSVVLCAQPNGAQPVGTATWFIGGVSPIDLSLMTQTSTGISYSGAVLLNPTAQQNINGQTLNMEGASVGFSAAASTTPDSFLSRIGNGIIGIGTAIGNALGVLSVATIKQPAASSFALLDPLGVSHLFISSSSPYVNTFINGNGAGSIFLGSAAKTNVSDTTGKITTAGGIALQTTSQTLPANVANDTAGGINITSNGGKTVNVGNAGFLNVLTPGAQLTLAGATSGSIGVAPPAVAGSNTLTLPAATGTLALGIPNFQKFTSSGTFTIPTGITAVKATVVSGGGAGGGTSGAASNNGVGGSSGSSAVKFLSGLTPGNTLTVTIGAGGTGVSNGTGNTGGASSVASGTQTITSILTNGGNGGLVAGQPLSGGAAGSGGDLNLGGSPGFVGSANNIGGNGATSIFGGGGTAGLQGAGNAATAPGAGGGGAGGNAGSASAGGAGASGIVIFEWVN